MINEMNDSNIRMKTVGFYLLFLALVFSAFIVISNAGNVQAAGTTVITTPQELHNIRHDMEGNYILGNDIDLDVAPYNSGAGWDPIGGENDNISFKGTFDGDGHKITGLMIDLARGGGGLFGSAAGSASFSNVKLVGVDVKAWSSVGGLVRGLGNGGLIENVHVTGTVSSTNNNEVGGVAGNLSNAKIKDSSFEGTVSGTSGFGTGGLVGSAGGAGASIENSTSSGTVSSTGRTVGGLAGKAGNVINSSSSANVSSTHVLEYENHQSSVGGLVGSFSSGGELTDSFATGNVEATNGGGVGGLIGYVKGISSTTIKKNYATGTVTGDVNVGGLVGYNNNVPIRDSYATGEVFGTDDVGGLIGHLFENSGLIEKSYSESTVIATGDNVGGLVGSTKDAPKIVDAYARGNVSGKDNVGGLVGFNPAATIHRSYATGKVTGQNKLGGLIGSDVHGKFSPNAPSFYDKQTTGMTDPVGATGKTTAVMQDIENKEQTYANWNFTSVWDMEPNSYPIFAAFADISTHWGKTQIREAAEKELINGFEDDTFRPEAPITRAQFIVIIDRAIVMDGTESAPAFTDGNNIANWAKDAVERAVKSGIVNGYDDDTFRPNKEISREEIAKIVSEAFKLQRTSSGSSGFSDDNQIQNWAKEYVAILKDHDIVQGKDGNKFAPKDKTKRVEGAVILLRSLE